MIGNDVHNGSSQAADRRLPGDASAPYAATSLDLRPVKNAVIIGGRLPDEVWSPSRRSVSGSPRTEHQIEPQRTRPQNAFEANRGRDNAGRVAQASRPRAVRFGTLWLLARRLDVYRVVFAWRGHRNVAVGRLTGPPTGQGALKLSRAAVAHGDCDLNLGTSIKICAVMGAFRAAGDLQPSKPASGRRQTQSDRHAH